MGDKGFLEKNHSRENEGILGEKEENKEKNEEESSANFQFNLNNSPSPVKNSDFGYPQEKTQNSGAKCVLFGVVLESERRNPNVGGSPSKRRRFSAAEKGKSKIDDIIVVADDDDDDKEEEKLNLDGLPESETEFRKSATVDLLGLLDAANAIDEGEREDWREYRRKAQREAAKDFAQDLAREVGFEGPFSNASKDDPSPNADKAGEDMEGPFDIALKMIKRRNLSLYARKVPRGDNVSRSRLPPSLQGLCLRTLSKHSEGITSLHCVPDILRHKLSKLVCDSRKIDAHFVKLLAEESPTEIRVYNSNLTEDEFERIFSCCDTKNLMVLQLDLCGSCITDDVLQRTIARSIKSLPALVTLSLSGAYRLSDKGLNALARSAPALQSINLSQCSLLTSDGINNLAKHFKSTLKELYLDDCQAIDPMVILPTLKELNCLEVLSLAGIHTVSDDFVIEIVEACGKNIKELVFANCVQLTDASLKAVGKNCSGLFALDLSSLCKLTDSSMRYLANGCKSITRLKLCRNGFSDEAIAAFLETSGSHLTELSLNYCTWMGLNTALALVKCSKELFCLDLSWCRSLTYDILELIVDDCRSLRMLKVNGCTQFAAEFLSAHSNKHFQIIGLKMTPLTPKYALFEPPASPLRYSPISC